MVQRLFGNEAAKQYFSSASQSKTLSHAYIIEGARGSGRHTLTKEVLLSLIKDDDARKRAEEGNSPDIVEYSLGEKRRSIGVDTVRALRESAFIRPSELDFRAFIISDADTMTVAAQNAALKILEEPPANVYFFLLCESASALLPTVRSRAQTVRMERFTCEKLEAFLETNAKYIRMKKTDPDRCREALRSSDGSIGRALAALEGSGSDKKAQIADAMVRAFCSDSGAGILKSASELPSSRADADEVLLLLTCALRDLYAVKAGAQCAMLFFRDRKSAAELAAKRSERAIFASYDKISSLRESINLNINMTNARAALARVLLSK